MLEPYIKQLLIDENEVVVPEVGTFVVTHNQAEILSDSITPPRRKIQFYSKLRSDKNEKLAKLVIASEEISREDFHTQLEYFIEQVQTQIDLQGSYQLLDLGKLGRDAEGYFTFSQAFKDEISEENFGLPPIYKKPLMQEDETFFEEDSESSASSFSDTKEEEKEQSAPFIAPILATPQNPPATIKDTEEAKNESDASKTANSEDDDLAHNSEKREAEKANATEQQNQDEENQEEENQDEDEKVSPLVIWLITIPLLAIFAFLLYLFTQPEAMSSFRNLLGMKAAATLPKEKEKIDPNAQAGNTETAQPNTDNQAEQAQNQTAAQDTETAPNQAATDQSDANQGQNQTQSQEQAAQNAGSQSSQNSDTQTASSTNPTNPSDVIDEERNVFYVIVGSFVNLEYARQMQQQVGQNSRIVIYPKGGNYRVTIAEQPSEREAYNERLRHLSSYPNAWVLDY
ncbi:SPOR domain-containing protein [Hugenholtzia roseola]|uniref:HU domain-containing protein n=1 Tax=Hugenholtzia roseola TaxID=1002 RepID=UPI000407F321|nr:SPOR domain-containing protein [Hugenholtzia roseola]